MRCFVGTPQKLKFRPNKFEIICQNGPIPMTGTHGFVSDIWCKFATYTAGVCERCHLQLSNIGSKSSSLFFQEFLRIRASGKFHQIKTFQFVIDLLRLKNEK